MFGFHHLLFFGFFGQLARLRTQTIVFTADYLKTSCLQFVDTMSQAESAERGKKLACGGTFLSRITKIIPRIRMVFRLHYKYKPSIYIYTLRILILRLIQLTSADFSGCEFSRHLKRPLNQLHSKLS